MFVEYLGLRPTIAFVGNNVLKVGIDGQRVPGMVSSGKNHHR
jgi:hypothetical protein